MVSPVRIRVPPLDNYLEKCRKRKAPGGCSEDFGEFKTSMYQLAFEQLPRWRRWRIFAEYDIARMLEVELTSEFALLMLNGITQKTQSTIDREYGKREYEYPERVEVERRFRTIMDAIDDRFADAAATIFRSRARFFGLFACIYDIQFGIESSLERKQPKSISAREVKDIVEAGKRLQAKTAPENVLEAVARRTTHQSSRLTVLNYLRDGTRNGQASNYVLG